MNKKNIQDITDQYPLFEIVTNHYHSSLLNKDKINFITEKVVKLTETSNTDVYLNVDDIRLIRGKK